MIPGISPQDVRTLAGSGKEYALLDMREEGAFSKKRLMLATCLPLSHLELRCRKLVPRKTTFIVLMDGAGDGLAEIGAKRLTALGYSNIHVLRGGVDAWEADGFPVYSGVNVMTKAFGEIIHNECKTPDVSAGILKRWIDEGRNLAILDARPFAEYHDHTIPGAISVPGAELAARVVEVVPDPETTIVVNCAGRTRSIIGCQSLINAGVPNEVYALRNGTMGWKLAGFDVETGATRTVAAETGQDIAEIRQRARALAKQFGVTIRTPEAIREIRNEGSRNVYIFDVRTPDSAATNHAPGIRNAPGGQLVQAMDDYVGVRNAVVVLTDPLLLRAVMTASWLNQIAQSETIVMDPAPDAVGATDTDIVNVPDLPRVSAVDLAKLLAGPEAPRVVDLSSSVAYRRGHVPGALWTVRGRTRLLKSATDNAKAIVLIGQEDALLRLAGLEIAADTGAKVQILDGGIAAWQANGNPVETGMTRPIGPVDDVWYKPFELDDPDDEKAAAQAYLDWEVELTRKVAADTVDFRPMHSDKAI